MDEVLSYGVGFIFVGGKCDRAGIVNEAGFVAEVVRVGPITIHPVPLVGNSLTFDVLFEKHIVHSSLFRELVHLPRVWQVAVAIDEVFEVFADDNCSGIEVGVFSGLVFWPINIFFYLRDSEFSGI